MNIDTKSWHFKYAMDVAGHPYCLPNGICGYFWCVVLSLLYALGRVLRIVALVALIGWVILTLFVFVSIVGTLLSLIVFIGFMVKESVISYKTTNKNIDKQPNILVEYLRAKKNKFCPNVTYTEGVKDGN